MMFFHLFINFLFNPRLLLSELRSEYGASLSVTCTIASVATMTLANSLVFGRTQGVTEWFILTLINSVVFITFAVFYLPVVHFFAEKELNNSRVTDLAVYAGFSLSPLLLLLPAAFFALAVGYPLLYPVFLFLAITKISHSLIAGIRRNYLLAGRRAVLYAAAPLALFTAIPVSLTLLFFLLIYHA